MKTVISITVLVLCAVNANCCVLWWQVSTCTWKPQIVTVVTVPGCTVHLWHQETRSVSASGTTCMAEVGASLYVGKVDRHVSGWQLYVLHTSPTFPPLPPPPLHLLACTATCTRMYTYAHMQTCAHMSTHTPVYTHALFMHTDTHTHAHEDILFIFAFLAIVCMALLKNAPFQCESCQWKNQ